jgi:hypothetical protein
LWIPYLFPPTTDLAKKFQYIQEEIKLKGNLVPKEANEMNASEMIVHADRNVKVARTIDARTNTEILKEGVGPVSCHHIAKRVSVHLVLFAAMSMVANKLLQWDLARSITVTTRRARKS